MRFDPDAEIEDAEIEAGLGARSTLPDAAQVLPAGRYGPRPRPGHGRRVAIGLGALLVVATAVAGWLGLANASSPVTWKNVGFDVRDAESVEVTFDVAMKPGMTAVCTLDALAETYAQVGTIDVKVGPSDHRESRYTAVIATSELATTAVVDSCEAQ